MPEFEHHHHYDDEEHSHHHHSSSEEHHHHHYDDDGHEHHHHHHYDDDGHEHHHHHHSSDSGEHRHDPDLFTLNGASNLNLGRVGLEEKTPRETKTAALITCLLTILIVLPVIVVLCFKIRNLTEENATLRRELGMKLRQIEKLTAVSSVNPDLEDTEETQGVQSSDYALASTKAANVADDNDDEDDDEDDEDLDEESIPVSPPAVAVKAAALSQEETAAIRREIMLMPNGVRIVGRGSSATKTSDPCAAFIVQAYAFVMNRQRSDAATSFRHIVQIYPYWPYGYFYLGLMSGDMTQLEKAAELFEKAELIGAATPESVFYQSLTAMYRKADFSAESFISRLSVRKTSHEALQTGPALYPPTAPSALIEKLKKIPGMPELEKFTPDWGDK